MTSLLAICRPNDGPVTVKRVQIARPVQDVIGGMFEQQAMDFLAEVDEEIPYAANYRPDDDELLFLDAPAEVAVMRVAVAHPVALDTIDAANFLYEHVKGLFVAVGDGANARLLVQAFTAQQFLAPKRFAMILDRDVFRQVTEPSFTLDDKLVAIVEGDRLKFRSFHFLKRIFVLEDTYRAATDHQIEEFCRHPSLAVADVALVKTESNQNLRKLLHAVHTSNVLGLSPAADIHAKAVRHGLALTLDNGRIVLPADKRELKEFLKFLDETIYEGPLSGRGLVASGKRPLRPV